MSKSFFVEAILYKALGVSIFVAIPIFWSIRKHIDRREESSASKKEHKEQKVELPPSSHPMDYSRRLKKQTWEKRRTDRWAFRE